MASSIGCECDKTIKPIAKPKKMAGIRLNKPSHYFIGSPAELDF